MRDITQEESNTLDKLREKGFAVVIFSPTELKGDDPQLLGDILFDMGEDLIGNLDDD